MEREHFDEKAYEWLDKNDLSYDIWDKKYRFNYESFDDWINRVSNNNKDVARLILDKKFIFGGRILANRRIPIDYGVKSTYSNCYVLSVDDSLESIYKCCSDVARTYSYGGEN